MRCWRRRSQRHASETEHVDAMLQKVKSLIEDDYKLGLELIACRRLVKGYGDTHARGSSKFDRLMRAAALADLQGTQLEQTWGLLGLEEDVSRLTLGYPAD